MQKFIRLLVSVLIMSSLIQPIALASSSKNVSSIHSLGLVSSKVTVRSSPSTKSSSIGTIKKNSIIKVCETQSGWAKINFKGKYGYVKTSNLKIKTNNSANVLGTFTTFYSTSKKGRCKNISKAAKLLNGYVIKPGAKFSLLKAIGPITKEGGYYEAPEYKQTSEGTETVTGYGGGVCQVATTLYQSICDAKKSGSNISIRERHKHSKPVSYVPVGQDATISWDAKQDFSFTNKNKYSITLYTYIKSGSISFIVVKN